jgi:hypothetical protein
MFLIVLTNWLWIPFVLWGDVAVRKALREGSVVGHAEKVGTN